MELLSTDIYFSLLEPGHGQNAGREGEAKYQRELKRLNIDPEAGTYLGAGSATRHCSITLNKQLISCFLIPVSVNGNKHSLQENAATKI